MDKNKYAKLLRLEFWLEDWFRDGENYIVVTIPVGIEFNTGILKVLEVQGNAEWLILTFKK